LKGFKKWKINTQQSENNVPVRPAVKW